MGRRNDFVGEGRRSGTLRTINNCKQKWKGQIFFGSFRNKYATSFCCICFAEIRGFRSAVRSLSRMQFFAVSVFLCRLTARNRTFHVLDKLGVNFRHLSTSSPSLNVAQWGTKKKHRQVKLQYTLNMADPKIEEILTPLRASVKEQVQPPYVNLLFFFN